MATNTKNKEWAKANRDMLVSMYEKGYISRDDLMAINNKDDKYSLDEQDAAFDRVKKDIQSRYSEDRLNSTDKLTEDERKSFRSFRESVDKFDKPTDALLSSKLIENIKNSGYKDDKILSGMTEQIKDMSDNDLREYIYNQRQFLNQMLPGKAVETIPDLQEYMTVQPTYGVKNTNYAKMFNDPDILDKLNELSFRDIDYVARKNGMSGKELLKDMADAKIAKDREDIAHGRWRKDATATLPFVNKEITGIPANLINEIGGAALSAFGRRQQEAIARGEDPSTEDYIGDIGEQALYMAPLGRLAQPISTLAKAGYGLGTAALVPHISEVYDAAVYDKDVTPRGEYNEADALVGTGVNLVAPFGIRMAGKQIGRYTSPKVSKFWGELAEGKSADDVIKEAEATRERIGRNRGRVNQPGTSGDITPSYYKEAAGAQQLTDKSENQLMKALSQENGVSTPNQQALNMAIKDPSILTKSHGTDNKIPGDYLTIYKKSSNPADNANLNNVYKYDAKEWSTVAKAMKNGDKTYKWQGQTKQVPNKDEIKAALDPQFVKKYQESPYASSMFLKSEKELMTEDALKNYLTNQFGNTAYENKKLPIGNITNYFGFDINQMLEDWRKEKEREEAKEKSKMRLPSLERIYGTK